MNRYVVLAFGLASLAFAVYMWARYCQMSLASGLGLAGGLVAPALGYQLLMKRHGITTFFRLLADDVSDEDVLAYSGTL